MKHLQSALALGAVALALLASGCDNPADSTESAGTGEIVVVGYQGDEAYRNDFVSDGVGVDGGDIQLDLSLDSAQAVIEEISNNENAVGFVTLWEFENSLTGTGGVTKVAVEDVAATAANLRNKSYPLALIVYYAYDTPQSPFAQDFIEYATSTAGQEIIGETGWFKIESPGTYTPASALSSGYNIGGSATVYAFAEELITGYEQGQGDIIADEDANGDGDGAGDGVDYESIGSGAGAEALAAGQFDVAGMSRDLKDDERNIEGLENTEIGYNGIILVVGSNVTLTTVTRDQVAAILTGVTSRWEEVE